MTRRLFIRHARLPLRVSVEQEQLLAGQLRPWEQVMLDSQHRMEVAWDAIAILTATMTP